MGRRQGRLNIHRALAWRGFKGLAGVIGRRQSLTLEDTPSMHRLAGGIDEQTARVNHNLR